MIPQPPAGLPTLEVLFGNGVVIGWTMTYILIIKEMMSSKSIGMPLAALIMNLPWEITAVLNVLFFEGFGDLSSIVGMGCGVVCLLDCVIMSLTWRNLRDPASPDFTDFKIISRYLAPVLLGGITLWTAAFVLLGLEFGFFVSLIWTAFIMNTYMSLAYILMFLNRRSDRGQSIPIAVFKFIGTLCASINIAWLMNAGPSLMWFMFALCAIVDIAYIIALISFKTGRLTFDTDPAAKALLSSSSPVDIADAGA